MSNKPILFSAAMVRAVLAGRKTQTRRLVKWPFAPAPQADQLDNLGDCVTLVASNPHGVQVFVTCPYGGLGDTLWVRETCVQRPLLDLLTGEPTAAMCAAYAADDAPVLDPNGFDFAWWYSRPKCPGIHMPRFASRLTLNITEWPDVQRLQEITYEDVLAEGFEPRDITELEEVHREAGRAWYSELWDSLNMAPGTRWQDNPYVWVNHFKAA